MMRQLVAITTKSRDIYQLCLETSHGALERIRTSDLWYRKPMLYPLSYEGGTEQGYQSG